MAGISWSAVILVVILPLASTIPIGGSSAAVDCYGPIPLFSSEEIRVFLTLSPLVRTIGGRTQQRQIELNWHSGETFAGDWIGLYDHDPVSNPASPLRQVAVRISGYYKTDVEFAFPVIDRQNIDGDVCLGYWIGYNRNGVTIASNCLKLRPGWMWQNRFFIQNLHLYELFLPGTHNAGSYREYSGHSSDTVFMRFLICQDEDIFNQLAYGIRYLDIRVGYYPDRAEKFYMNHNYARINPLKALIEDLKIFLKATRELVVLDFHRFPVGFSQNVRKNREIHSELVSLIVTELGEFMIPSNVGVSTNLSYLWSINRTLIVTYADDYTRSSHPLLWPSIPQEWGDKRTVEDLHTYLGYIDRKRKNFNYFWAAMAELTPSTFDVLFRPGDGLRKLADQVSRNVTSWYRDDWWKTTSIVAVDFFHSTDIIDVAVEATIKRARCSSNFVAPTTSTTFRSTLSTSSTEQSIREENLPAMIEQDSASTHLQEKSDPVTEAIYQSPRSFNLTFTATSTWLPSTEDVTTTITTPTAPAVTRKQRMNKLKSTLNPSTTPISDITPEI